MFSTRTLIARGLIVALVATPGFVMNGCKKGGILGVPPGTPAPAPAPNPGPGPDPRSRPTQVSGMGHLLPGSDGNLGNSMAALYRSLDEWRNYMPFAYVRVSGSGPEIAFVVSNITPGVYYLDVWKDRDNSASWTIGDFIGWYGNGALGSPYLTPFSVREGQTFDVGDLQMYLIGGAAQASKVGGTDK